MRKSYNVASPRYRQIAVDIAAKIADGKYRVGDKVYARSLIASQYAVSAETARRAIALLSDMDIVEAVKGSGVVIKSYENAMDFVKLNHDNSTIEHMGKRAMERIDILFQEIVALKEQIGYLVDRTTQVRNGNPFIPYEVKVEATSPHLGRSLSDLNFWQNTEATVVAIRRENLLILSPGPYETLQKDDEIYFVGNNSSFALVANFLNNYA